jgi:hypothetical protein
LTAAIAAVASRGVTVLWRVCQLLLAHVRLQVDERDDAFVAVERARGGNGWTRICRHGLEKIIHRFPPRAADVDVKELDDQKFFDVVWRAGDAARDAGAIAGSNLCDGGFGTAARFGCVRVRVTLLLLLQLLSVMSSMSLLQCRACCTGGRTSRILSPSTLQQEACRINRMTPALSLACAARRPCSLFQT